jgi:hypothetical protein
LALIPLSILAVVGLLVPAAAGGLPKNLPFLKTPELTATFPTTGSGTGRTTAAVTAQPATAPAALPTFRPASSPVAAPANGCPANPALVRLVNGLGADLVLKLSLDQIYRVSIPAGQARNLCLPPGQYTFSLTAQGFIPKSGTMQLVAGVRKCWWLSKGQGGVYVCDAPADASDYWPP